MVVNICLLPYYVKNVNENLPHDIILHG